MDPDFLDFLRFHQEQAGALPGQHFYNATSSDDVINDTADAVISRLGLTGHRHHGNLSEFADDAIFSSGSIDSGADSDLMESLSLDHYDFLPEELPGNVLSLFTVLYVVVMILGLGGNAMTALVVAVNREMRTVTNVFLLSLAASDALIAGVNMPAQLMFYTQNEWTLGQVACKLTSYTQGIVIVASILTLTSLALDRYFACSYTLKCLEKHFSLHGGS